MKTTLTGIGALASLLVGTSGNVLADTNTYAGALCEPQSAATPFARAVAFGIGNPSINVSATYFCPLVRDNLPAANALVSAATVLVDDFTTSGAISCTLSSKSATGSSLGSSTRSTTAAGVGIQELTFGVLPTSSTGYLTLHCAVPVTATAVGQGTSRVISYRATEL